MKLKLDTTNKTIEIEEAVNIGELLQTLKRLLPNNDWKKFTLQTTIIQNWSNPIYVDRWVKPYPYPWTPWYDSPWYIQDGNTKTTDAATFKLNDGTYCLEVDNQKVEVK
jgi:hypothetical protein